VQNAVRTADRSILLGQTVELVLACLGPTRLQLHLREERWILLRQFSPSMASTMSNRDHVLRHLLILALHLSDVELLRVMINMSAAFTLFLGRRLADVEKHTLQVLLLHR
jgi:hypothetical protein